MKLKIYEIILLILIFIPIANAIEYPSPNGFVHDFAGMEDSTVQAAEDLGGSGDVVYME